MLARVARPREGLRRWPQSMQSSSAALAVQHSDLCMRRTVGVQTTVPTTVYTFIAATLHGHLGYSVNTYYSRRPHCRPRAHARTTAILVTSLFSVQTCVQRCCAYTLHLQIQTYRYSDADYDLCLM